MRLRFVNIVDNFHVLIPESQVKGMEALRTNEKTGKRVGPLFDSIFANKVVVTMSNKQWIKLQGYTYFAQLHDKDTVHMHKHIESMCHIVETKAHTMRLRPRSKSPRRKTVTLEELEKEEYDGGFSWSDSDEEGSGDDSKKDDSEGDDSEEDDSDDDDSGDNILVETPDGLQFLVKSLDEAPKDRVVVTVDRGHYGHAIFLWLVANMGMSTFYHGSNTLADQWRSGGLGTQTISDLFLSPVKYWSDVGSTVAYVIPEMSETSDVLGRMIENAGVNDFPTLSQMTPSDFMNAMNADDDDNLSVEMEEFYMKLINEHSPDEITKVSRLLGTAGATAPTIGGPLNTLRLTKVWLHFKSINFFTACVNILYAAMPAEAVSGMAMYMYVGAQYGLEAARAALYDATGGEMLMNQAQMTDLFGPVASEIVSYSASFSAPEHTRLLSILATDDRVTQLKDAIRGGFDIRYQIGANHLADYKSRITQALILFIPGMISITMSTAVVLNHVYKALKRVFRKTNVVVGHNERVVRTTKQKVGRFVLDGLDFFNAVLVCTYSALELCAMAGVADDLYRMEDVIGRNSLVFFRATTALQFGINAAIRQRYNIDESPQSFFLNMYGMLAMYLGVPGLVEGQTLNAIFGGMKTLENGARFTGRLFKNVAGTMIKKGYDRSIQVQEEVFGDYHERLLTGAKIGGRYHHTLRDLVNVNTYMTNKSVLKMINDRRKP